MKKLNPAPLFTLPALSFCISSCSAIEGIFKAGMGVGIFLAVVVVIIIVVIIMKVSGKKS